MIKDVFVHKLGEWVSDYVDRSHDVAVAYLHNLLLKLTDRVISGGVEKPSENVEIVYAEIARKVVKHTHRDVYIGNRYVKVHSSIDYELKSNIIARVRKSGIASDVELKIVYESMRGGHIGVYAKLEILGDSECHIENSKSDGNVHVIGPIVIDKYNGDVKICGKLLDSESGVKLVEIRYLHMREWAEVAKELKL